MTGTRQPLRVSPQNMENVPFHPISLGILWSGCKTGSLTPCASWITPANVVAFSALPYVSSAFSLTPLPIPATKWVIFFFLKKKEIKELLGKFWSSATSQNPFPKLLPNYISPIQFYWAQTLTKSKCLIQQWVLFSLVLPQIVHFLFHSLLVCLVLHQQRLPDQYVLILFCSQSS